MLTALSKISWIRLTKGKRSAAVEARKRIEDSGPTYVKLGQLVATRGDLFDPVWVQEFSKLQDNAKTFDSFSVIKKEINLKDYEVSKLPFASASLSCCHDGLYCGQSVVLKVRRPDLESMIKQDIEKILKFLEILGKFNKNMKEMTEIVTEWQDFLLEELDFKNEIQNLQRFQENARAYEWVRVPQVFAETENIIIMEKIEGSRVTDADHEIDRRLLARSLITFTFDQIYKFNFFHADPHPGNILIDGDGKVSYIDFGLCVDVGSGGDLEKLLLSVAKRDIDDFFDLLISLNVIIPTGSPTEIKRFLRIFFLYLDKPLDSIRLETMRALEKSRQFRFSTKWILFFKSIACIQGIVKEIQQDVEIRDVLKDYASAELPRLNFSTLMEDFAKFPGSLQTVNSGINMLEDTIIESNLQNSKDFDLIKILFAFDIIFQLLH
jgi:ubiquinone biosynthesis protein